MSVAVILGREDGEHPGRLFLRTADQRNAQLEERRVAPSQFSHDGPPSTQHTRGCEETLASGSQGGSRKFSLPDGIIVLPGTGTLSFLVDWTMPSSAVSRSDAHPYLDDAGVEGEPGVRSDAIVRLIAVSAMLLA